MIAKEPRRGCIRGEARRPMILEHKYRTSGPLKGESQALTTYRLPQVYLLTILREDVPQ